MKTIEDAENDQQLLASRPTLLLCPPWSMEHATSRSIGITLNYQPPLSPSITHRPAGSVLGALQTNRTRPGKYPIPKRLELNP